MDYLMGIDIGTSSTRAVVIDLKGDIIAIGQKEYAFDIPREGWAEQDPQVWWDALKDCCAQVLSSGKVIKEDIKGIGYSGQMHGLVPMDKDGKCIRNAIIWCDQRSKREVKEIEEKVGRDNLARIAHSPVATGFLLPSLLWMRRNEKERYDRISTVFLPKDYIRYRMTGKMESEVTDAASTVALDCNTNTWSDEIIDRLDLDKRMFPPLGEPEKQAGTLTSEAAEELGLRQGTVISYGGGDQIMQALGNGVAKPGEALVTIGTAGQILMPLEHPVYDKLLRSHCFSFVQHRCYYMGAVLSSGLSLRWMRNNIAKDLTYKEIDAEAEKLPPGSGGLIFLPYLSGERTPHMDPYARGMLFGTVLSQTRINMLKAVMEGVVFSLRDCLEILTGDLGQKVDHLIASGGGSQSKLWVQIQADILGRDIYTSKMKEQSGVGAAITAGIATGLFSGYEDAFARIIVRNKVPTSPIPEHMEAYDKLYGIYKGLYASTKGYMRELSLMNE